ncbi:type 1 glutamine amidotransferase [Gymnodinialimonas sp. 2305UL16-5]|uniref:type 1 glutamine amidotransferase n=1 Tax=Gymnodinialimonas mytili TaxID=3126503 RepID=UPI0030B3A7BE
MRLGILQCGHVPDEVAATDGAYGALIGTLFAHRGFDQTLWSVVDHDFPPGPDAADGWLVTGSKHGAYEAHSWIPPLEDLIRAIAATDRPLVGICFGHQIIAQALGGQVEKFHGGWQVGRRDYRVGDHHLAMNAWHQDQVTALPPDAQILGETEHCAAAILAIGPRILTVQPHPEFPSSVIETLLEVRSDPLSAGQITAARNALDRPNDNRAMADWLADVLEGADARHAPRLEAT